MNVALRARNVLSLCAGVGGLELGISLALGLCGERTRGICYVEREAAAAASLVASMEAGWIHPAPVWSDLTTFDARRWRGLVHILASGDPCQDNSVAGKQAGSDGERFLAPEVIRIAEECWPDLIFRENVPGNADGQLEAIVPALERLGFVVAAGIFSSAETGNTMRRERLFIMAIPNGGFIWDRGLQRCGQFGFLTQDDGIGRRDDAVGRAQSDFRRSEQQEKGKGSRRPGPSRTGDELGSAIGSGDGRFAPDARRQAVGGIAFDRPGVGSVEAMGGTSGAEPQGQQRGQHHTPGRQIKGGHSLISSRTILPPAVIPGPTDSRWIDVLDRWPELQPALSKEEAESHLRRGIDAMASRVERLRATGNGVDPLVAAYAFLSLGDLLAQRRNAGESVLTPPITKGAG